MPGRRELSREEWWARFLQKYHPPRWELVLNEDGTPRSSEEHKRTCVALLLLAARRSRHHIGTKTFEICLYAGHLAEDFRARSLTEQDIESIKKIWTVAPYAVDRQLWDRLQGAHWYAMLAYGYIRHPPRRRHEVKRVERPQTPHEFDGETKRLERHADLLVCKGDKSAALATHRKLQKIAQDAKIAPIWSAVDAATILKQIRSRSHEHGARRFGLFRSSLSRNYQALLATGPRKEMIRELRAMMNIAAEVDAVNFADCERDLRRVVEWLELKEREATSAPE